MAYVKTSCFPDKMVFGQFNWFPWPETPFLDWMVTNKITLSWPDTIPATPHIQNLYSYAKAHRSTMNSVCQVQMPDYDAWPDKDSYPKPPYTPEQISSFIHDEIDPWYIVIATREPMFSDSGTTTIDSYYQQTDVKTWIELEDEANAAGWSTGHGPSPPSDPEVTVIVSDATATEAGTTTGSWKVHCPDCTGESISWVFAGDAVKGTDYSVSPASPQVHSGADITVTLTPIDDTDPENDESATLILQASTGVYALGTPYSGSIVIANDDGPPPSTGVLKDGHGNILLTTGGAIAKD